MYQLMYLISANDGKDHFKKYFQLLHAIEQWRILKFSAPPQNIIRALMHVHTYSHKTKYFCYIIYTNILNRMHINTYIVNMK